MKSSSGNKRMQIYWALLLLLFWSASSCSKSIHPSGEWKTTAPFGDSISFLVVGDWGKYGGQNQKAVADRMDICAKKHNVQFIISTGDNFYPKGVSSTTDIHWQNSFERVYNKEGHQVDWYPVLGNHDYYVNPHAQIEYTSVSRRWKMPGRYYAFTKSINNKHAVLFAFTDTSPFVSMYHDNGMADLARQDTAAQLRWLQQTLMGSKERWKIVIGHHPVYSAGAHGNTPELVERFKPVLNKSRTDFYISGHDHSLQYIKLPNEGVHYLISGGGSENTRVNKKAHTVFARSSPGFLVMTLYTDIANFYFYSHAGRLLYQKQIKK